MRSNLTKLLATEGLLPESVTTDKIADGAITGAKLATGAVTEGKLASNAVTTGKIANGAVTKAKLASDVFASGAETGYGDEAYKAVSPKGLKQGIGGILPASVSYGDFGIDNIPIDSINEDVTSIFGNPVRDAGLRTYSATPQQVGAWIDGTPVWRVGIKNKSLSASDFDRGYYQLTAADLGVVSCSYISVILNSNFRTYYPNNDAEDSDPCGSEDSFRVTLSQNTEYIILKGYIEFATPASNIITS